MRVLVIDEFQECWQAEWDELDVSILQGQIEGILDIYTMVDGKYHSIEILDAETREYTTEEIKSARK